MFLQSESEVRKILIGRGICVALRRNVLSQMPLGLLKTEIHMKLMALGLCFCWEGYGIKHTYGFY